MRAFLDAAGGRACTSTSSRCNTGATW
jgi:hypothetical protein